MGKNSTQLLMVLVASTMVGYGCAEQDDRSSNGAAVRAQASSCIHAVQNANNISFLNTCEYPITAVVFDESNLELDIEPHSSVDRTINIPDGGLDFAACRQPYVPQKEVAGQYYCDSSEEKNK